MRHVNVVRITRHAGTYTNVRDVRPAVGIFSRKKLEGATCGAAEAQVVGTYLVVRERVPAAMLTRRHWVGWVPLLPSTYYVLSRYLTKHKSLLC